MPESLQQLEVRRRQVLAQLSVPRDMRRGSITETYRRCGKTACWCHQADQAGHGPFYAFTTKVEGKTQTLQLRAGPELIKLQEQVAAYREFRALCEEVIGLSEKICQARPAESQSPEAVLKKNSYGCRRGGPWGDRAVGGAGLGGRGSRLRSLGDEPARADAPSGSRGIGTTAEHRGRGL